MTQAPNRTSTLKTRSSVSLPPPPIPNIRRQARLVKKRALFYGHETIAMMSSRFIKHLFACPDYSAAPRVKLSQFIAHTLHKAQLHPSVLYAALVFLQRLKTRFPEIQGSSGHRLIMTAIILASKFMCDDSYTNKSWEAIADGMFTLSEINQMEREMCSYLGWHLSVHDLALTDFEKFISKHFSKERKCYPTYVPPTTKTDATPQSHTAIPPVPDSRKVNHTQAASSTYISDCAVTSQPGHYFPRSTETSTVPPPPKSIPNTMDDSQANGTTLCFTHVEEAPTTHPLQDQMFAFTMPSTF